MTETEGNEVKYVMKGGFSFEGLEEEAYFAPLVEAFRPIGDQNESFLKEMDRSGFDPAEALESNVNGAAALIRAAFEVIADYEEGRVPWKAVNHVLMSTDELIRRLKMRKGAPKSELDAVKLAFRSASSVWAPNSPRPMAPRGCYIKSLMKARDNIFEKLNALHLAYAAASYDEPKRMRASRRSEATRFSKQEKSDRLAVLRKIDELCGKGRSVRWAVECLQRDSYWRPRMSGRTAETWRRYYTNWKKR